MNRTGAAAMAGVLTAALIAAPAGAQTVRNFGQAAGWRIQQVGNDACVMTKNLGSADSIELMFRLEPGQDTEMYISGLMPQAVPDPDAVDWGRLTPVRIDYALADDQTHSADGDLGYEYVDATRVRVVISLDLDEAAMARVADAATFRMALDGEPFGAFPLEGANQARTVARRCLRQLR